MQPNNYQYQNPNNYSYQPNPQQNPQGTRLIPQNHVYQQAYTNNTYVIPQQNNIQNNINTYQSHTQTNIGNNNNQNNGFGLSKLSTMGRVIKEQTDLNVNNQSKNQQTPSNFMQNNTNYREDKLKMASSMIFQRNNDNDFNRFPGFNVGNTQQNSGTSKLDAFMNRNKQQEPIKSNVNPNETPEERRKREIQSIKNQFATINKKLETRAVNREEGGQKKQYFQLPTRKPMASSSIYTPQNTFESNSQQINNRPLDLASFGRNVKAETMTTSASSAQLRTYVENKPTFQSPIQKPQNFSYNNSVSSSVNSNETKNTPQTYNPVSNHQQQAQNNISEPPKQQEGGMFKKKNLYINEQTNAAEKKTFILSPKAGGIPKPAFLNNNNNIPISNPVKVETYEAKQAEVYTPVQPKREFMKKTESFDRPSFQPQEAEKPRVFQKSDFKIGKKMGKGQFGEVMLVQHKLTGFLCGMKVMSKKQIKQQKYVNQIARELSIQFYLNHRNVAPLYGYFQDKQNVYLLVEFCTGGQLLQMLRKDRRMEESDTSPIIRQICQGLDYVHKEQIIHRDIKPENILFNFNTVKICDFGWAVHCGKGMRKTVSGSPLYYSPEVVMETQYDEKVDIWAIGMMTYECLLGKIPFKIYSQLDLNRIVSDQVKFPEYVDVTDQAKDFILGIMKKNPEDRMGMKEILRHPFIKKYLQEKKVAGQTLQEFKRLLN